MSLPNVLENIVGEYTDEKDYKNLIKFNPKVHTSEKLVCKQLTNVPEDTIIKFRDSYNRSLILIDKFVEDGSYLDYNPDTIFIKVDPNYVTGIIMADMGDYDISTIKNNNKFKRIISKGRKNITQDDIYMYLIFLDANIHI